jgi:predicted O-methyltransferase YrrM
MRRFRDEDFTSVQIEQRIGDLGDPSYLSTQVEALRSADLIFIDGPKDGEWEQHACLEIFGQLLDRQRLVVFDDIRLMSMVQL